MSCLLYKLTDIKTEHDHFQVERLGYTKGQAVFEAGCAAGAFLDSLARQYRVYVSGVDFAGNLVEVARRRVKGSFCTADARNLSFVADNTFDHSLSFGVLTYADSPMEACQTASELLRIIRPGGTVFLGQINDPSVAGHRSPRMEGGIGVHPDYWHKFGYQTGVNVNVTRGEEIYSKRIIPTLDHYDLHGYLRYNVYMQKDATFHYPHCNAFRSRKPTVRFTVEGVACAQPFCESAYNHVNHKTGQPR